MRRPNARLSVRSPLAERGVPRLHDEAFPMGKQGERGVDCPRGRMSFKFDGESACAVRRQDESPTLRGGRVGEPSLAIMNVKPLMTQLRKTSNKVGGVKRSIAACRKSRLISIASVAT